MNNKLIYDHFSHVATSLMGKLKSMLITKLTFNSIGFYLLDILPSNSDSKIVYDHIHLLLSLNQLQRLIIKRVLDYAIRNKEKIYFESNQ